jgi:hypothetical protein
MGANLLYFCAVESQRSVRLAGILSLGAKETLSGHKMLAVSTILWPFQYLKDEGFKGGAEGVKEKL